MNKIIHLIVRFIFIVVCYIGIYTNIIDTNENAFMGNGTALNFYTIQSNILVLGTQVILLIYELFNEKLKLRFSKIISILKFVSTTAITLTLLVFWGMLAPYMEVETLKSFSCILVHLIIPLGMILDFLFCKDEYEFEKKDIFFSLIPPVLYFVFCLVRAEVSKVTLTGGSRFPYWFIDIDVYGWLGNENGMGVLYWVMIIAIIVLFIAGVLYLLNKKISSSKLLKNEVN